MAKSAVVDDSELTRRVLCDFLTDAGHQAVACGVSTEALQLILEEKPDLAVLDYAMPGLSGTELLADLRAREATRRLPVVFLSGTDFVRFAPEIPEDDLIRFTPKPLEFERLQGLITDLLSGGA